jgi:oligopeptide transport system permease protein
MAARTLGARDWRIIWKHIFPNTLGTIITGSVLAIPGVIFTESMLSFLGIVNLGGQETTSLGTLLSDASEIWINFPHLMLFPALIISLLMICFNLFGNGLRDAFNPSLRGVED